MKRAAQVPVAAWPFGTTTTTPVEWITSSSTLVPGTVGYSKGRGFCDYVSLPATKSHGVMISRGLIGATVFSNEGTEDPLINVLREAFTRLVDGTSGTEIDARIPRFKINNLAQLRFNERD